MKKFFYKSLTAILISISYIVPSYGQTNPGGIPGSILWLRADIGTNAVSDGDGITFWNDQSGNNFNASGTGEAKFSTANAINGNPVILFSDDVEPIKNVNTPSTSQITRGASPTSGTDQSTIFVVQRSPDMNDDGCMVEFGTPSNRQYLIDRRYDSNDFFNPRLPNNRRNLLTVSDPGGSGAGNNSTIFLNSGSYDVSQNLFSTSWTTGSYVIGDDDTGGNRYTGEIGEIIYYDYELTTIQRRRVESYLALKYGITLVTNNLVGHTPAPVGNSSPGDYISSTNILLWDASANAAYHNDVIGIGRDDGTALDQRASTEFNEDPSLATALSIKKADTSTPFDNDLDYLMTGHDVESLDFDAIGVGVPSGITQRSQRTWFVQTNGTPGLVTISLTLGGTFLNTGNATEYALLIDTDEDFTSGATVVKAGGVLEGNLLTFPNVNLSDGDYFTLSLTPITEFPGNVSTDLSLWLRADAGTNTTTNGGGITSWEDQSVEGSNASGTGNAVYSDVNDFNFNPVISFTNDQRPITGRLNRTNGVGSTVFVVGELTAASPRRAIVEFGAEGPAGTPDSNTRQFLFTENYGTVGTFANPINVNEKTIFTISDEGNQDAFIVNQNNSLLDSDTKSGTSFNSSFTNASIGRQGYYYLGDDATGGDQFTGEIAEVIYYDTELSALEKRKVEGYLAVKYGITLSNALGGVEGDYLDSDGNLIWDASANALYHNDVIGIGRNDITTLNQPKSAESTETTALTIEKAGGFEDDQDFMLVGNDNGGLISETAGLNPVYAERIQRTWKVANTGNVNDVTVSITLPAFATSTNANDYALLIDNDTDFSDSDIHISGASLVEGVLTFTNVNFPNNAVFTVGVGLSVGPANVTSGLTHWFRADSGTSTTTNGSLVNTWNNQTGSNNATINTGGVGVNYNTNNNNFNPSVFFDNGDNGYLNFNLSALVGTNYNVLAVVERDVASANDHFLGANFSTGTPHDNQRFRVGYRTDTRASFTQQGVSGNANANIAAYSASNQSPDLFTSSFDGGANRIGLVKQGVLTNGSLANMSPLTQDGSRSTGYIGNGHNLGSHGFNGNISEIIIYTNILSALDEQKIQSYLAIKYGITLPSGVNYLNSVGTVIWDATANSVYHNNIAGIGRDVASNLLQKQSKSENPGTILTISKSNSIAVSNNANPANFTSNLDFLIWGNDSSAALALVPHDNALNDCLDQVNRNWKVSNSGNVNNLTLRFDISGLPTSSTFNLVIDVDGDGNYNTGTINTISTGTVAGSNISFNNVSLPNGAVFTLVDISTDVSYTSGFWSGGSGVAGEFDDSVTDLVKSVTINNDVMLSASHNCKCLRVANGAKVTVSDDEFLKVTNTLNSNGSIYLEGDAELVQTDLTNTNSGSGQIFKIIDDATASEYRYNYFASPVNTSGSFTLSDNLKFNTGVTLGDNTNPSFTRSLEGFGTSISTRWTHTLNNGGSFLEIDEDETMAPGVGFTMKGTGVANQYNFIGSPNNGNINVPITTGNFLLTGNPYASTIDLEKFNDLNSSTLEGIVYLWDQPSGDVHATGVEDDLGGYATFMGGVGSGVGVSAATLDMTDVDFSENGPNSGNNQPSGFAKPGQGFVVYATATGNVQFDNSLRDGVSFDGSRHFFKANSLKTLTSIIRLGFEYTKADGRIFHRQIATSLSGNSLEKEAGKDAFMFDYFPNDAFWVIPEDEDRYVITSVPYASDDLVLPLGVVVENDKEITFKLDGVENYNGEVYLYDEVLKTITNIKKESHKVTLSNGEYRNRFSIMFNNQGTLSNEFVDNKTKTLIRTDKNEIEVILEKGNIKSIELYSLSGGRMLNYSPRNSTNSATITTDVSSNFYIIKIITEIGTVTKKIYID
ncbi:hypothetical protein ACXGQW_02190 [Wenyingzhuangia sp. IMCC45533]